MLQAENEQDMNEWVSSIRTASTQALNSDNAPRYTQQSPNLRKVRVKIIQALRTLTPQETECCRNIHIKSSTKEFRARRREEQRVIKKDSHDTWKQ